MAEPRLALAGADVLVGVAGLENAHVVAVDAEIVPAAVRAARV